ncbi:hypothetical protein GQX73_g9939 [Xylaria multiplex]|uniref:Uncharacterized protein n=1 Tax=Xylaria multiplex TaxID=323545 RepID=A0A7C8IK71_9PEZI|nr:hypothetical protein GQX73_g9939 [Xylaria multiplex]
MPTHNTNVLLQFLVICISLVSALQVDVIASNSTRSLVTRRIQTVNSTSTASFIETLASTAAVDNTEVNDVTQGRIIGEVDDAINTTTLDHTGLAGGAISIKKGGGAAGVRGSGSSGGSNSGGTSNVGSGQDYYSNSGGSIIDSANLGYPGWFPLGGGLFLPLAGDSARAIGASTAVPREVALACTAVLALYGIL